MLERVNQVFGPKGLGWNLLFSKDDVEVIGDPATAKRIMVRLTYALFQYTLVDAQGERQVYEIPTGGVNTNEFAYAEEGARTSALGAALKGLGFQLPVYKGLLDHHNAGRLIGGNGKSAAAKASGDGSSAPPGGGVHAPTRPGNGRNGAHSAKTAPEASNQPEIEDLDGPALQETGDPGRVRNPGRALRAAERAAGQEAGRSAAGRGSSGLPIRCSPAAKRPASLQAAAKAFLARQPA